MCPRPHLSLCAFKTSWLAPELQVSVCPRPHLSFCACKTAWLAQESLVPMGPSPHLWFCACKTATLGLELQVSAGEETPPVVSACKTATSGQESLVSMGPSPHLWFLHAKQRVLDQNYNSLWIPDLTFRFVHAKTEWFPPEWQVSKSPRQNLSFCAWKTATLAHELLVSIGPNPYLWFLHSKQRLLDSNNKSLRVPDITCRFVHAIQRD